MALEFREPIEDPPHMHFTCTPSWIWQNFTAAARYLSCRCDKPEKGPLSPPYRIPLDAIVVDESTTDDVLDHRPGKHRASAEQLRAAQRLFVKLMAEYEESSTPFIDSDFAPSASSLGDLNRYYPRDKPEWREKYEDSLKRAIWRRPEDRIPCNEGEKWALFDNPSPLDVLQGRLSDCWLLAVLCTMAKQPELIDDIFITKQYNPAGIYQLQFCIDGEWKIITVDGYFPFVPEDPEEIEAEKRPALFAGFIRKQLWVALVEKAVAKAFGSYDRLVLGSLQLGWTILTGKPCDVFHTDKPYQQLSRQMVWDRVVLPSLEDHLVCCGTTIPWPHAVAFLDAWEGDRDHRAVLLRDPPAFFEDLSSRMVTFGHWPRSITDRLLREKPCPPGMYWISYDFLYTLVHWVRIVPYPTAEDLDSEATWSVLRVPLWIGGAFDHRDNALLIDLPEPATVRLSLHNTKSRAVPNLHPRAAIGSILNEDLLLCVHRVNSDGTVGRLAAYSKWKSDEAVNIGETKLKKGLYVIIAHSLGLVGVVGKKRRAALVVHCERQFTARLIPCAPLMYTDSLIELVARKGRQYACNVRAKTEEGEEKSQGFLFQLEHDKFAGTMVMLENLDPDCHLQAQLDTTNVSNYLYVKSRPADVLASSVPPMHRQLIFIMTPRPGIGYLDPEEEAEGPRKSNKKKHKLIERHCRKSHPPGLDNWAPDAPDALNFPAYQNTDLALLHQPRPIAE